MRGWLVVGFLVAACGEVKNNPDGGSGSDGPGSDSGMPFDVVHVPASAEGVGTMDLTLAAGTVIDTATLTIGGQQLATFMASSQDSGGPDVAVLRVKTFAIMAGSVVVVRGNSPLVVIADEITIDGVLDAGGKGTQPGPGAGLGSRGGAGTFETIQSVGSGGGGGGYGGVGGFGGGTPVGFPPGAGGAAGGTPELVALGGGGSGGDNGVQNCGGAGQPGTGGGGGGSVQLAAATRIAINGTVNAGGGGGVSCQIGGGGGGGSGGAIYLQSPMLVGSGRVVAGGGGGAGGGNGATGQIGMNGGDAVDPNAARGGGPASGAGRGGDGSPGGDGLQGFSAQQNSASGGGGGGAAGRIVIKTAMQPTSVTIVPAAKVVP